MHLIHRLHRICFVYLQLVVDPFQAIQPIEWVVSSKSRLGWKTVLLCSPVCPEIPAKAPRGGFCFFWWCGDGVAVYEHANIFKHADAHLQAC